MNRVNSLGRAQVGIGKCLYCGEPLPRNCTKYCSRVCRHDASKAASKSGYQKKAKPSAPAPIEPKRRDARHEAEMHVLTRVGKLSDDFKEIERSLDDNKR